MSLSLSLFLALSFGLKQYQLPLHIASEINIHPSFLVMLIKLPNIIVAWLGSFRISLSLYKVVVASSPSPPPFQNDGLSVKIMHLSTLSPGETVVGPQFIGSLCLQTCTLERHKRQVEISFQQPPSIIIHT